MMILSLFLFFFLLFIAFLAWPYSDLTIEMFVCNGWLYISQV